MIENEINFNEGKIVNTFIIEDCDLFIQNLKTAYKFINKDSRLLTTIKIEFKEKDYKIVSTDGKVLFLYQSNEFKQEESEWHCNIPFEVVYSIINYCKENQVDKIVFQRDVNNYVKVEINEDSVIINNNKLNFPNYEIVLDRDYVYKFKVNTKEIKNILKSIKTFAKNSFVPVYKRGDEYKISIDFTNNKITQVESTCARSINFQSISNAFKGVVTTNCIWLLNCLKNVKSKEITLFLEQEYPYLKIEDNKTIYVVILIERKIED